MEVISNDIDRPTLKLKVDNLNYQKELILNSLYEYYCDANDRNKLTQNMKIILPILLGKSKISIRVLDWFVTNFSKKNNIIYSISNDTKSQTCFNVYLDYKSQLKGYKKKLFDPFCRKKRITFYYLANKCIITTIGQLNFFRWAISNKILDYIEDHYEEINKDMNECCKYSPSEPNQSTLGDNNNLSSTSTSTKKRHELSESASKTLSCYSMNIKISFDI